MKRFALLSSLLMLFACACASAQDYPNKPVTIYVPFAAGGGTDLSLRMLEEAVSKNLGQKVVIVNKTGTATIYQVVTGTPDGYTLVVGSTGNLAAVPHNPGAPYAREDYIPVVQFTNVPALLVVPGSSPFHNMADIVAVAKSPPGTLKVGISPTGSISHLAAIQLEKAFGIKFGYIPHKSNGDVMTAVLGGHVDIGSVDIAAAGPKMASNSVRGIALYNDKRLSTFPELRTLKEQGADISFGFYNVILAPKGTPDRIVAIIHEAFKKALEDPVVIERSKSLNLPIAYLGPQDARKAINQSYDTFGRLLDELGLKKNERARTAPVMADVVSGLLFCVLGGVAANHARSFGLGTLAEPGAGFFPFWGGILIAGCSAAIVVNAVVRYRAGRREEVLPPPAAVPNWRKAVMCVCALLAYAAMLPWLGFSISTFLTMLALSRFDPRTSWRGSVAIAGLGAAGFWLLFVRLLGVSFPPTPLGL